MILKGNACPSKNGRPGEEDLILNGNPLKLIYFVNSI